MLGVALVLVLATGTGARAECYPPDPGSNGQGRVDRSRVAPGECVIFSGSGFRPRATLVIADDGDVRGTTRADSGGDFSTQVCFPADSRPGAHTLTATGPEKGNCGTGKPGDRTVMATVYVLGAGEVAEPEVVGGDRGANGGNGGGLPFSGDITLLEGSIGLMLLLVGLASLLAARPRRRSASPA